MGGTIKAVKKAFKTLVEDFYPEGKPVGPRACRFAVADFKDAGDGGSYALPGLGINVIQTFTSDKETILSAVRSLGPASGGCDTPEEWQRSILSACQDWTGLLGGSSETPLPVPPGRYRVILLATDATGHLYPDCCDYGCSDSPTGDPGGGGSPGGGEGDPGIRALECDKSCYPTKEEVDDCLSENCITVRNMGASTSAKEIKKEICRALQNRQACNVGARVSGNKLVFNRANVIKRKMAQFNVRKVNRIATERPVTLISDNFNPYIPDNQEPPVAIKKITKGCGCGKKSRKIY